MDPVTYAKISLANLVHMSGDVLHVHLGLMLFLVVRVLVQQRKLRRRGDSIRWAWLAVLSLALLNEMIDLAVKGPGSILGSFKDVFNTMVWPTVLAWWLLRERRQQAPGR